MHTYSLKTQLFSTRVSCEKHRNIFVLKNLISAKQLRNLINTISNAAAAIVNDPDKVFETLSKLGKLEGAYSNLRGFAFEALIACLYVFNGYQIDHRQTIRASDGKEAEIDIKAVQSPNEVVCIECKSKVPDNLVDVIEVKDWVENRLPRIKDWLTRCPSLPTKKRFEFCISSEFTEQALSYTKEITIQHKEIPLTFLSGIEIRNRLSKNNQKSLVRIFDEYFPRSK